MMRPGNSVSSVGVASTNEALMTVSADISSPQRSVSSGSASGYPAIKFTTASARTICLSNQIGGGLNSGNTKHRRERQQPVKQKMALSCAVLSPSGIMNPVNNSHLFVFYPLTPVPPGTGFFTSPAIRQCRSLKRSSTAFHSKRTARAY